MVRHGLELELDTSSFLSLDSLRSLGTIRLVLRWRIAPEVGLAALSPRFPRELACQFSAFQHYPFTILELSPHYPGPIFTAHFTAQFYKDFIIILHTFFK